MAPFTNAANKAIPARTISAVSREGIFSFSQLPASGHLAPGIIAQRLTVSEGAHAVATRLFEGKGPWCLKGRSLHGPINGRCGSFSDILQHSRLVCSRTRRWYQRVILNGGMLRHMTKVQKG